MSSPSTGVPPSAAGRGATPRAQQPSLRGMAAIRAAFRVLSTVSPAAAARVGDRLFFRPMRARVLPADRAVLATARRGEHRVMGERLVSYAWGDGPPVLLLHGWGGHAGHMAAFVEPLAGAGLRVVAVDMPGHGASGGRSSSIVHFAATVEQLTRDFLPAGEEWHAVVGHSLATPGILRALTRGVRARRVVAIAPPAHMDRVWAVFRRALGVSDPVWARMRRIGEKRLGIDYAEVEPLPLAARMKVPLLVVHDGADREIDAGEGAAIAAAWPGAVFHRTEGLGHVRILKAASCVQLVVKFIRD